MNWDDFKAATFSGLRIVETPYVTRSETRVVQRTWRERWLTRPWTPRARERRETVNIPACVRVGDILYMHPAFRQEVRAAWQSATPQ